MSFSIQLVKYKVMKAYGKAKVGLSESTPVMQQSTLHNSILKKYSHTCTNIYEKDLLWQCNSKRKKSKKTVQ